MKKLTEFLNEKLVATDKRMSSPYSRAGLAQQRMKSHPTGSSEYHKHEADYHKHMAAALGPEGNWNEASDHKMKSRVASFKHRGKAFIETMRYLAA